MINLNQLRFFHYVAKNLSFTIAANELLRSQPAVTKRIKELEKECGLKLFGKRKGKTYITEEGKVLFEHTKKMFEYEHEIEKVMNDLLALKRGVLRIGVPKMSSRSSSMFLTKNYSQKYPNVKIEAMSGNSQEILEALLEAKIELGNLAKIEDHPDINFIPVFHEKVSIITGPGHRLAGFDSLTLEEVAEEPIVLREKGSWLRKLLLELFERKQLTPNILRETNDDQYMKDMLVQGQGISLLAEAPFLDEIKNGDLVSIPLVGDDIYLDIYLGHLKQVELSMAAKAYLDLFKSVPGFSQT